MHSRVLGNTFRRFRLTAAARVGRLVGRRCARILRLPSQRGLSTMSAAARHLLHASAFTGDASGVRAALEAGADANDCVWRDSPGCTPLFEAALNGHNECVKVLLEAGALVNLPAQEGEAILPASLYARRAVVDTLIAAGADVNRRDADGRTALGLAAYHAVIHGPSGNRRAVILALLRAGASELPQEPEVDLITTYHLVCPHHMSNYALLDKIRKAGGWANFARDHRRVLSSLVSKLSAKNAARPIPVDAAGHVVGFWTPPGGR